MKHSDSYSRVVVVVAATMCSVSARPVAVVAPLIRQPVNSPDTLPIPGERILPPTPEPPSSPVGRQSSPVTRTREYSSSTTRSSEQTRSVTRRQRLAVLPRRADLADRGHLTERKMVDSDLHLTAVEKWQQWSRGLRAKVILSVVKVFDRRTTLNAAQGGEA